MTDSNLFQIFMEASNFTSTSQRVYWGLSFTTLLSVTSHTYKTTKQRVIISTPGDHMPKFILNNVLLTI